ncbi:MAG TPA: hypothetical protein VE398_03350 [Acidobacteriota bacterium]|nr:hypothetical protein [Acidobacteriota bacterium]
MKSGKQSMATLTRREFLASTALAAGVAVTQQPAPKTIGIQVGAVSFVDEGVDRTLDILQERGAVNAIFLTTFTYGRGLAGRQIPGQVFPDHGAQESDEKFFHGGNYATPHAAFYERTSVKQTRAPDHGDLDIVSAVLPSARKRGMKLFCSVEDVWRADVPGIRDAVEVDIVGRRTGTTCLLHPDIRAFWTALVTDLCSSYDIDGILFFNERNGSLLNALGASHAQRIDSSRVTCFCDHHKQAAGDRGIDFERVRQGYLALDRFVRNSLVGTRPTDGYFVEFWRILVEYPETLLWDKLFDEAKHRILAEVRAAVKAVRPSLQVGFHIEHVNSFNPVFRATRSYEDLAGKADFLKIVVYNNCGGERYARYIDNIGSTIFRDVPKDDLMRFNNYLLNYSERGYDELAVTGLSADYVYRETQRALAGVQGKCRILPGIDIGIPTGAGSRKATPEDTYDATLAALKAGAQGVILSRKYSEMRLANLSAAGRAARSRV